jgi:hypothetical protein
MSGKFLFAKESQNHLNMKYSRSHILKEGTFSHEPPSYLISKDYLLNRRSPSETRSTSSSEMCSSCIKMKNLMDEAKFSIEREKESLENTEKHLKHYDSLLAIKENRLREQELALENERNLLEIQKSEISREKITVEKEKEQICDSFRNLELEKENIEKQMMCLDKKYQEVKKLLGEYEKQKSREADKEDALRDIENRENALRVKDEEICKKSEELTSKAKLLEKSFKEKVGLFEKLKQEVINKQKVILRKKAKIAEMKKKSENCSSVTLGLDLNEKEMRENALKARADELQTLQQLLNDEKNRVEVMMRSVNEEKLELDQELHNSRRLLQEKIHQAQMAEERFKERYLNLDSKEKKLEHMIQAFQEEESKLEERWKNIENIEKITNELALTKEKLQNLQKQFFFQQQELNEFKLNNSEFTPEMKEKLENLRKKEEELFEIEQQLKKEREEIEISATLIKQLNNDLEKQKISQQKEQQRLKSLEKEIKQKENEEKSQLFQLEVDKSFKNSSQGSFHKILVSDMSPFDDKELFPL